MEQIDVISKRTRWVAVATGIVSALAFFPIGVPFAHPLILIVVGFFQPRFPRLGRWLLWIGSVGLGVVLIQYDVLLVNNFSHHPHDRVELALSALAFLSTILLIWCYVELILQVIRRMLALRLVPWSKHCRLGRGERVFVAILNLLVVWSFVSALIDYHHSLALVGTSLWAVFLVAFDLGLAKGVA